MKGLPVELSMGVTLVAFKGVTDLLQKVKRVV
jgi:hypothetical protein